MNAPRRLAPLPLLASLLRTPRRLTSSRLSPSGKSLPSSPLVLTASRRIAPKLLLLIGLAALAVLVLITDGVLVVHAQSNQAATGRPRVLAAAQGAGILVADTEGIDDGNGLPIDTSNTWVFFNWTYQWIRVKGNSETNVGANSATYHPVEADVGNQIKVRVSFTDGDNFSEARTSLPFGPITKPASSLSPSTLVSNTGQSASSANITQRYALGFRLGDHGQGYEISSVSIDLAAAPSSLTVSLWSGGVEGGLQANTASKLFDFENPSSFRAGLNKFTAPAGAFAYQNVNYFVVLSGFGSTLSIKQTTSNNEDAGGETGAVIYDDAAVRASATGYWSISADRASVLRLVVSGSRRTSGILVASYAQPHIDDKGTTDTSDDTGPSQEIISVGDKIGLGGIELGAADRYLIRGVSFSMDNTTPNGSGFTNPLDLRSGSRTGAKQFSLTNSRKAPGLPVWTAPQGATVTGGNTYVFDQPVGKDDGPENTRRRDATLSRLLGPAIDGVDDPAAEGVSITGTEGDVAGIDPPYMAVLGEPLDAMVQNLGQVDSLYVAAGPGSLYTVVSQGFTTGSNEYGYRVQGIGVNIEGSDSKYPDGPTSVSVAVHEDSSGKPGDKLFDLVSPDEFGAGHSFFEAPPGTNLEASTSYVLVWRHLTGTTHRLQRTSSNSEDSGKATGSSIANAYYSGADLGSLSEDSGDNSVEIAVYTEVNTESTEAPEAPEEPPEPPFDPGITGGGPGHFGGDAILRCSAPPTERCLHNPYGDVPAEGAEIWSATLTVGKGKRMGRDTFGWDDSGGFTGASLTDQDFTFGGDTYEIDEIYVLSGKLTLAFDLANVGDIATQATRDKLILHVGSDSFNLWPGRLAANQRTITWFNTGLSWAQNDTVEVKLTEAPEPNAYGYRTIWTALMTAEEDPNSAGSFGYLEGEHGKITNNLMVDGRDETVTIGTPGQPRYPWTGYEIRALLHGAVDLALRFVSGSHPRPDEVAGWTLVVGGKELPFAAATSGPATLGPGAWNFSYIPGWTAGDQVVVSIRNYEVQNRMGRVEFSSRRDTSVSGGNIVYGKTHFSYDHEPNGGKFGPADVWELRRLNVTTDKTGDTDPVWISATFRAHRTGAAGRAWQGYWEGQFDDFHTLFLRWIYNVDGIGKGEATYTLPLRSASGTGLSQSGRDVTFTWERTYKEFQRRHLDLANHAAMSAHMLAPSQPATARAGGEEGDGDNLQRQYVPTTVTSVDFTSNPGSDRVYGLGDTIQVTVAFSDDVTVSYNSSKKHAAEVDLELGGQTRTAHYARTDGNKVILEYTVVPGDEETFALLLPPSSLRLDVKVTETQTGTKSWVRDSWIRDSEGRDAVLDHNGLGSTAHRVDAVSPEFASAQVSTDGAQVAVTFNESIKSPAILRAFGVQTSLLQSLTLDVRVDGELAARSDAAVSGDTVTLTMAEPVTQGQTVAVSYDNLFVETGESILEDLYGNNLLTFTGQPATNGSTLADVDRPDGGLALSRTDLEIDEGESGTYTVALASQPAADVTVEISQRPTGRATVSPASLTFTADNWNTPQTVTITSTEDANYVDRWVLLRHVATGDDYGASAAAWLILRDTYNVGTTPQNNRATGSPTISGTPQVGQTLTLDTSAIADADGLDHAAYTYLYQWLRNNAEIKGATGTSYTLVNADRDRTIKVKVSFLDDANNQESRTSAATVAVAPLPNSAPTGAPTISGTPQVGETLTADTSAIDDADGLANVAYRYQWVGSKPVTDEDTGTSSILTIEKPEQTDPTYTLLPADEGLTYQVKVSFTDDAGNAEFLTSAATEAVTPPPNYEPTGLPAITGTPQVGETLTAGTSAIDDADGLTNVSYSYQWLGSQSVIDENTGTTYYINVEIPGATGSTYTLAPADKGRIFAVRVSFTDDRGNSESLTSRSTVIVAAKPNSQPTGLPAITGTPQVGETLTADTSAIDDADGLTNVSYEYRWTASKTVVDENTGTSFPVFPLLSGDTGSTHTLAPAHEGYTFQVRVSFTDDEGNNESLTSQATVAVAATVPTAPQSLSVATGDQAQELEASWQAPSSNGGSAVTGYRVQWKEAADSWDTAADVSEATETRTTHTITDLTGGVEYAVRVMATNDEGDGPASTEAKGTPAGGVSEQVIDPENSVPTGLPGISGTPQVDQTLMASTSDIEDADGLTNATFEYQWTAGGTDIGGATGSTYTLTPSEQGQTIRVRVTFTDDAENEESLTSAATVAVAAAPAPLTAAFQDLPDSHDGSATFTFQVLFSEDISISYVNMRDDAFTVDEGDVTGTRRVDGRNDLWEITVEPDGDDSVAVTLTGNRACTAAGAVCTKEDTPRQLTNSPTATVTGPAGEPPTNRSAAGAPTISGTPQVDQTLTADTSAITDEDGLENVSYSYQWLAGGSDISGATGSTYTLTASQQGQTVQVRVDFEDDGDNEETLTSEATVAVAAAPNREATGEPTIGGTPQVGETLTASTSAISDEDGLTQVSYSYQWNRNNAGISGATGSSYTLTDSDQGGTITVQVTFTDDEGNAESLTSAATGAVSPPAPLTATLPASPYQSARHKGADDRPQVIVAFSLPVASFEKTTPSVSLTGATLSSVQQHEEDGLENAWMFFLNPDGADDIVFSLATGQPCDSGGICAEDGTMLSSGVQVTLPGPDEEGEPDSLNSPATGLLTVSGTPQVDQTLTADTSEIDDEDGLTNVSYGYQWIAGGSDIAGATGSSYLLTASEQGQTIQVRVTFTDDGDNEESLTSAATEPVLARPNRAAAGRPTISGTPQVDETLTADTTGISDEDGLTNVSYGYQWIAGGSDIAGATGSTYTLTVSEQGETMQVRVSFTDDGDNEETLTSVATEAVAPKPVPLTATFSNVPTSHDGSSEFTFTLSFSENVRAGYARIRDHAFTIDEGDINKAQRVTQGSNQSWTITVKPDGNGDVKLTLPSTTDCDAEGAICTYDDRMLSHSTTITIAGPGE